MKKILIVGYGISGKSLEKFLKSKDITVEIYDDKINNDINWENIDAAFISPGIPRSPFNRHQIFEKLLHYRIPIISDYDILQSFYPDAIYIGVTGTAGKTTTTRLISHFLQYSNIDHYLCGNLGIDIFEKKADIYVMEIGAAQLELTQFFSVNFGVITNIYPDHIDFFGCYERYVTAKINLLRNNNKSQYFHFGKDVKFGKHLDLNIDINSIPDNNLRFSHNIENINAALDICIKIGCSKNTLDSLTSFELSPYRQKIIYKNDYLTIVNDSKCTNSLALEASLKSFNNLYLFLGGRVKNLDFSILDSYLDKIHYCVCFGLHGEYIFQYFKQKNIKAVLVEKFIDIEPYLKIFIKDKHIKTILFSPLGQSLDEFNNYNERGKCFDDLVQKYII